MPSERATDHSFYMNEALAEAREALALREVPIGAVIVRGDEIVGRGHNRTESSKDPRAHAEMLAIGEACKKLGGWRLPGCRLYVTAEPCAMCAGAILLARIEEVYIGVMDPKAGACGSLFDLLEDPRLNHQAKVCRGLLEEDCGQILKEFFRTLRAEKRTTK